MVLRRLPLVLVLVVAGLASWAFWIEPSSLGVREYEVPLRNAPAPIDGLRIAVIADLHSGAPFIDAPKLRRVAAMANASHPDLIVVPGDIFVQSVLGGHAIDSAVVLDALAQLHAPLGVYSVLGNHDNGLPAERARYQQGLQQAGIVPLDNAVHRVDAGAGHFWMAGFGDLMTGNPQIEATLAQIGDSAPVIAITHNPELFPAVPPRVNLLIAGHTHGGQVRLSLLSLKFLNETRTEEIHFLAGQYHLQTDLFVSPGIGTTGFPVRFRVPPEISVLTLRQDPAK